MISSISITNNTIITKDKNVIVFGKNGSGKTTLSSTLAKSKIKRQNNISADDINARQISVDTILAIFHAKMGRQEQFELSSLLKIESLNAYNEQLKEIIDEIGMLNGELSSKEFTYQQSFDSLEKIKNLSDKKLTILYDKAVKEYNAKLCEIDLLKKNEELLNKIDNIKVLVEKDDFHNKENILKEINIEIKTLRDNATTDCIKKSEELIPLREKLNGIEKDREILKNKSSYQEIINLHDKISILKTKKAEVQAKVESEINNYTTKIQTYFNSFANRLLPQHIQMKLILNKRGKSFTNQISILKNGKAIKVNEYMIELSESQLRLLAIIIFLSVYKKESTVNDTIILDDIFNTLDDATIDRLTSIVMSEFKDNQLLVLTHSNTIYNKFIELKFIPIQVTFGDKITISK